ncbi:MAG: bifunctional adenosylcobinamide kinase/adenosylcobinamide-phosphate guanylyltransferase [Deltaproteobacteria bacterium]|nr:bifunctional adenosylcobinamide kinase/adenosylcobinamide-phosphate guanylyltransferase [Deltaproteobacteria bacterium]
MGTVCLVVGGRRSGKSEYARALAEKAPGPRAFVATCPALDKEMAERIRKHREQRKRAEWDTIEEPIRLSSAISNASNHNVVLVDCLTLWINNLMYEYSGNHLSISEEIVAEKCDELIRACSSHHGKIILVTNETGLGIVPDNEQARLFLDLVGRCNQIVSEAADEVILVICGQPLIIKKGEI